MVNHVTALTSPGRRLGEGTSVIFYWCVIGSPARRRRSGRRSARTEQCTPSTFLEKRFGHSNVAIDVHPHLSEYSLRRRKLMTGSADSGSS